VFLSSVSASLTPPWPGLGAYIVSKAALDKLVEAYREEYPAVGFTRLVVGECAGGEGDSMSGFADGWDPELAMELAPVWMQRNLMRSALIEVEELVDVVDRVLRSGSSLSLPSVTVAARPGAETQ
jgi:NAD(P)-dependent dehydrogenase (short-subunit alcohol dehydrogenase family)